MRKCNKCHKLYKVNDLIRLRDFNNWNKEIYICWDCVENNIKQEIVLAGGEFINAT